MKLFRLIVLCLAALGGAAAHGAQELLEPEDAFRFSARAIDPSTLEISYRVAPDYYLYRKDFRFELRQPPGASAGEPKFPRGQLKHDLIFGDVEVYRGDLKIVLPLELPAFADEVTLQASSRGCSDSGVCYTPQEQTLKVRMDGSAAGGGGDFLRSLLGSTPNAKQTAAYEGDEAGAQRLLRSGSLWPILAGFFALGLLLAFTPCMLPMIPILSGIVVGQGAAITRRRAVLVSVAYVLGMALTYTLVGILAGLSGSLLSTALQNPWVLGGFSLLFVALALSLFGFYELRLPASSQAWLADATRRIPGGRLLGAWTMGMLSALIIAPCVAAPLAGALLYIGQTQDVMLGGLALFSLAMGMGLPLIAVGASAGALLPRAGAWTLPVQRFFGVVLLAVAIWTASPLLPAAVYLGIWAALLIVAAVFLRALDPLPEGSPGSSRFAKGVGVISLLAGTALLAGALVGSDDPLRPLGVFRNTQSAPVHALAFQRVATTADLDAKVAAAAAGQHPVMLDFYADWCVSCKEMERFTFSDERVRERLQGMVLLQADVTRNTADDAALLRRFRLFGPPGIVFFDSDGKESPVRVIGFQPANAFLKSLDRVASAP